MGLFLSMELSVVMIAICLMGHVSLRKILLQGDLATGFENEGIRVDLSGSTTPKIINAYRKRK